MTKSEVTKKTYDECEVIYMSNPQQCYFYFTTIGCEHFVDLIYNSNIRERALIFVWDKCKETAECKRLWDENGKNRNR